MFQTEDLYLAAALQERGHPLRNVWRNGNRSAFEFADDEPLQLDVAGYFNGSLMLPAHSLAERIRSAKSAAVNAVPRRLAEDETNEQVPAKLLLDISEVASVLGLGRSHVYAYVMRGDLPSLKLGRRRKITVEAVREFIQRQQAAGEQDA